MHFKGYLVEYILAASRDPSWDASSAESWVQWELRTTGNLGPTGCQEYELMVFAFGLPTIIGPEENQE